MSLKFCLQHLVSKDWYGRGVVRGAVETTKLILDSVHHDPTRAESVKTAQVTEIALSFALKLLGQVAKEAPWPEEPCRKLIDMRNPKRRCITDCPHWTIYGNRGQNHKVHQLSAYEFFRHFCIERARHPLTAQKQLKDPEAYEAEPTPAGIAKLQNSQNANLVPGKDYHIREEDGHGNGWMPMGKGPRVAQLRHDWVIARRPRPYLPVIYGAQGARTQEEQAMRILVLFFPFVLHKDDASPKVPFINDLWQQPGVSSWEDALLAHADSVGFPTQEARRLTLNFCFAYCLPREMHLKDGLVENSDNEDLEDELVDLALDEDELLEATMTRVKGNRRGKEQEALGPNYQEPDATEDEEAAAGEPTYLYEKTMEMIGLSDKIWHRQAGYSNSAARARYEELKQAAGNVTSHDGALQAARNSQKKGEAKDNQTGLLGVAGMPGTEAGEGPNKFKSG